MTTAHEAFRIALAAHDVRTRSHAARNNSHVAFTRTYCALARDEHVLTVMVFPGLVVVMAAHDLYIGFERRNFSRALNRPDHGVHHQVAGGQGVLLGPMHGGQ